MTLRCSECGETVDFCENCGRTFEAGDTILCTWDGHFCSEDCYSDWLLKSKVYSEGIVEEEEEEI